MKFLLDTNICIAYLNGRSEPVRSQIEQFRAEIAMCSIVKAELFYGAAKSQRHEETLAIQLQFVSQFPSLPFDDQAAEFYSRIRAELAKRGTPIGPNDLLIAAIALANNLILVTHNTQEFSRVNGLKYEDWETVWNSSLVR